MTSLPHRRLDLDWIRVTAFVLLILYHVGMLYVSWGFHVKSLHDGRVIEPLMIALNPWRLAILFLVSGAATRFMLDRSTPGTLAGRRSWRLLVPLLFGMIVVVPPQSYAEVVEKLGFSGGYLSFWFGHYLRFDHGFCSIENGRRACIILPTWNHLWFVAYLWLYTMAVATLAAQMPAALRRAERWIETWPDAALLLGPALLLAAFRGFLFPISPVTHALVDDGYAHAVYGSAFLFGVLIARSDAVAKATVRLRWPALLLGLASYLALVWLRDPRPAAGANALRPLVYGVDQWCWIVTILGFARHWLATRDNPVLRYACGAVFCWYIVHQTIIVMVAHHLKGIALPAFAEAATIIAATMAGCAATYEVARRVAPLGTVFGIAPPRAGAAEGVSPPSPR
ncbi:MAG: acyltransferase family protein [Phreatobacter sp.]|uniref:acyltransferase family protein n=1 Tax=Phreatobacter sp. TaxID=1966341 RepID=UPI004035CC50